MIRVKETLWIILNSIRPLGCERVDFLDGYDGGMV